MKYKIHGEITVLFVPCGNGKLASCWIDTKDLPKVKDSRAPWRVWYTSPGRYYVACTASAGYAMGQTSLYLHHLIAGNPADGYQVDHKNGNTLDCRRSNLRTVTCSVNNHNRHHSGLGINQIRGVKRKCGNWYARVGQKHLGSFPDVRDAASAVYHRLLEIDPVAATSFLHSLPNSVEEVAA